MRYNTIYPKYPTVKGALSREVLASRAVEEGYCVGPTQASDYDVISAAVLLKSKESIQLCLDLGISPFCEDNSCVLNLINFDKNNPHDTPDTVELLGVFIQHKRFDTEKFQHHSHRLVSSAIANNNLAAFDFLVQAGADPYQTNKKGRNTLHLACNKIVEIETMEVLLDRYPDMLNATTDTGGTALIIAAEQRDDPRAVYRLLEAGADPLAQDKNMGGLLHSMKWKKYQVNDLDPNEVIDSLRAKISKENWEKLIRQDDEIKGLPFHVMAQADLCIDFSLLAPDGNVNAISEGREEDHLRLSALGVACLLNSRRSIRKLIEAGADFGKMTAKGHTCWHLWAAMAEDLEKADGAPDYYNLLVKENHLKFFRRLFLKTGVSPEIPNDDGEHPVAHTNSPQAKLFFAEQRKKALELGRGKAIERKRPVM